MRSGNFGFDGDVGEFLDFGNFLLTEPEISSTHHTFGLLRAAGANNGPGDGGMTQDPCNGDFAGTAAIAGADRFELFDQFEIPLESLGSRNSALRRRKSSMGSIAARSRVIPPESSPENIGE